LTSADLFKKVQPFLNGNRTGAVMSLHSSLKAGSKITAKRNVLKRFERVEILKQKGKWKDGDRGLGLPKTKR